MNGEVDRYLRRATRGLWGTRKREVREELATHIEGRVHAHRIAGLDEETAVQRTLSELGKPAQVNSGMMMLHTLPLMSGLGVAACCLALTVLLLSNTFAQPLRTLGTFPAPSCLTEVTDQVYCLAGDWIDLADLRKILEPQGVTFESENGNWQLTFPGYSPVILRTGSQDWTFYRDDAKPVTLTTQPDRIQLREMLKTFAAADLPVALTGWDTLDLRVAGISFELAFTGNDYSAKDFYLDALTFDVFNEQPVPANGLIWTSADEVPTETKNTGVQVGEGDVYGVAVRLTEEDLQKFGLTAGDVSALYVNIVHATREGMMEIRLPDIGALTFVKDTRLLYRPGDALLVRLSGKLANGRYNVVPPTTVNLER